MKKTLLSLAAMAIAAMGANAQNGAPLYATGDFDASYWDPTAPVEFTYANDVYTLTLEKVSKLKISTVEGTWDEFNGGSLNIDGQAKAGENALVPGTNDIAMPWEGEWTLVVNNDLTTLTLSTTTPQPGGFTAVYLRGDMNGWSVDEAWEFTTNDGNTYVLKGVTIDSGVEFKIADANWSNINYGYNGAINLEERYELISGGDNISLAEDAVDVNVLFVLDAHTLLITAENIDAPEAYADVYVRGSMNNWDADNNWKMTTTDGIVYTIQKVEIPGGAEFKIADANWGDINYGASEPVVLNEVTDLVARGSNIKLAIDEGLTVDITFNLEDATLLVTSEGNSISSIASDNASAVYYNVNGVRVDNPTKGFYIVKQGNKVSKTYIK